MAAIAAAAIVAYHNCFSGPFVLDDHPVIEGNRTIRALWPLSVPLSPPQADGSTAAGRPLVNLTLAVNYAFGGTNVRGYHAVNLLIHVLAGLVLFGIVRWTLLLTERAEYGADALVPALCVALVWVLHPLTTAAVTYLSQRAEALVGLAYLLTLYCFIRAVTSPTPRPWYALSTAACFLGMASKEVMVSAPLVVWLYDRTFVAGSFAEAWRRRKRFYLGLFASWLLLAYLVAGTQGRGGTAGLSTDVTPWTYILTQCEAVVHYLRLAFWPRPLVFDYGMHVVRDPFEVVGQAALLLALLVATLVALRRWPVVGFAGAAFFLLLAPSSSVVPVATQTIAEHRMYLPLAVIVTVMVAALYRLLGSRAALVCFVAAAILGALTMRRNEDYRSERLLWEDTLAKVPLNARAHSNLGKTLIDEGRPDEAFPHLLEAVRIGPQLPAVHYNLGLILNGRGRKEEARSHYETAVQLNPKYAEAHVNLGSVLMEAGKVPEAMPHLERAVELVPDLPEAQFALANGLMLSGKLPDAADRYGEALRLRPNYAMAHANLGSLFLRMGRPDEAAQQFQRAIEIEPNYVWGHYNLGMVLLNQGRTAEASSRFAAALQVQPDFQPARDILSRLQTGAIGTPQ